MINKILKYDNGVHKIYVRGSYLELMSLTQEDIILSYDNIIYAFNDTFHTNVETRSIGLGIIKRFENIMDDMTTIINNNKIDEVLYNSTSDTFTQFKDYCSKLGKTLSRAKFEELLEVNK